MAPRKIGPPSVQRGQFRYNWYLASAATAGIPYTQGPGAAQVRVRGRGGGRIAEVFRGRGPGGAPCL